MKFLVTGDAGKLGSRIKPLLDATGYDIKRGQDIMDVGKMTAAFQGMNVVVHCAGIPHPTSDPLARFFKTNVQGTLNVCMAAEAAGVQRVVYFSSTAWYGCNASEWFKPLRVPIDETHPANPQGKANAYGVSKRMAENILHWYGTNGKLEVAVLRSGPANPKAGQYPGPLNWQTCNDYRRGCLFTNCHPDRAADAAVKAATTPGLKYEVFNIMDRYTSERVDLPAFMASIGFQWDSDKTVFSTEKAQRMLGWEPSNER